MVWAGIMINGRTRLHVVANGTMTGQRYIDEVLLPHDCLDSEGIQRLVWPARSPDLNPIENVWDALGRPVADRNYPPTNKNTLIRALTEEWDKLPQLLDNVVQIMVRHELLVDDALSDNGIIDLTLDITVDGVVGLEGDNFEEEKSTPLTGKLIQEDLQFCSKLENHFLINDPNSERAYKLQRELQNSMSGYREL
ncbi:hypothetical protein TNCV_59431 [Trichonephila clavipes]|nr:hypothetical protein TNCV_59431 [Trichonephila clavipes]